MPTARLLLDLDDDALARVLVSLSDHDWLFVALACRGLHRAALRAFEQAQADRLRAAELPGVVGDALVVASHGHRPSPFKMGTSVAGIMRTPKRFAYAKQAIGFPAHFHHHALTLPTSPNNYEFYAASKLSTAALFHMLKQAPVSMIRGSFFDALGGLPACRFMPGVRDHAALLTFAAYFGRVDVLDWLVHKDPTRAKAYDYDHGLLAVLDVPTLRLLLGQHFPTNLVVGASNFAVLQQMLVRPAYMSNSVQTLQWIEATVVALARRRGVVSALGGSHDGPNAFGTAGFFLGVSCLTRSVSDPNLLLWRGLREALSDAAAVGATHSLDCVFEHVMRLCDRAIGRRYRRHLNYFYYLTFSILLFVLKPEHGLRNGATLRWLIATCHRFAGPLTYLARFGVVETTHHAFNSPAGEGVRCFDFLDLAFVLTSEASMFFSVETRVLLGTTQEELSSVNELLVWPGDVSYNRWLLKVFARPNADDEDWQWVERSYDRLFPVARLDANGPSAAWTGMDWLCSQLLRKRRRVRKHLTAPPNPETTRCDGIAPFVYWSRLAEARPWLPHERFAGPTRLEDGQAFVLGEWIEHAIRRPAANQVDKLSDWWAAMKEMPVACVPVLEKLCARTLAPSCAQRDAAKRILRELLYFAISHFGVPIESDDDDERALLNYIMQETLKARPPVGATSPHAEERTCALAYARLAAKHGLLTPTDVAALLKRGDDCLPPFRDALARAFGV